MQWHGRKHIPPLLTRGSRPPQPPHVVQPAAELNPWMHNKLFFPCLVSRTIYYRQGATEFQTKIIHRLEMHKPHHCCIPNQFQKLQYIQITNHRRSILPTNFPGCCSDFFVSVVCMESRSAVRGRVGGGGGEGSDGETVLSNFLFQVCCSALFRPNCHLHFFGI